MIKNLKNAIALSIGMIACSAAANAQEQQSATNTASATIITPMTITSGGAMNFGNIISNLTGGTVLLSTDNSTTPTGVEKGQVPGTISAATFDVTGQDGYAYAVTLPTTYEIVTGTGTRTETQKMTLTLFTTDASKLLTNGADSFKVGATLTVRPGQSAGDYTGTSPFEVSVNYN